MISFLYLIRQIFKWYYCNLDIAIFAWRVTCNYAYSPFNIILLRRVNVMSTLEGDGDKALSSMLIFNKPVLHHIYERVFCARAESISVLTVVDAGHTKRLFYNIYQTVLYSLIKSWLNCSIKYPILLAQIFKIV